MKTALFMFIRLSLSKVFGKVPGATKAVMPSALPHLRVQYSGFRNGESKPPETEKAHNKPTRSPIATFKPSIAN
jgi:hypothetical protein